MKAVGLMTLLSVAVTAAAPDREAGRAQRAVESRVAQEAADCLVKTNMRGSIATTGDLEVGKGAKQCVR